MNMNKLKLGALLLAGTLSVSAQTDTICTMVRETDILKFNYYTSEITNQYKFKDSLNIYVDENEVLCLHLFTGKRKKLKVITVHEGHEHEDFLQSKDNVYYTSGPVQVIIIK